MATTVIDEEGIDVGTTPTIHAKEPPNKLLFKINYSSASDSASDFTLGGTMGASYFIVVKPADDPDEYGDSFGDDEFWVAAGPLRLPDDAAGTITFDGPTGLTTLNPIIISSQNRPTHGGVFGQIPTEYWLRYKMARDRSDTLFQEVPLDAPFPDGDFTVTSFAALTSTLQGLTVGAGQKYRIKCKNGDGSGWTNKSVGLSSADKNFMAGGGYCVIEPDPDDPISVPGRGFISHKWEGVELRWLDWPGDPGTFKGNNLIISGVGTQVNVRGLVFVDPEWVHDTSTSSLRVFIAVTDAKSVRLLDNKMTGGKRDITLTSCWYTQVRGQDVGQTIDDFCDPNVNMQHIGRWPDDDLILEIHDGRVSDLYDLVTGVHLDFSQASSALAYPTGLSDPGSNFPATDITLGSYRMLWDNLWKCTTAGKTSFHATRADLPTDASASPWTDGTVVWTYVGPKETIPKCWLVVYNNILLSGGTAKGGVGGVEHPGGQFLINSNAGASLPICCFNNFSGTPQQRGINMEATHQTETNLLAFNTFVGPHEIPTGTTTIPQDIRNQFNTKGWKTRAYKNFCGGFAGEVVKEGNRVLTTLNPPAGRAYADQCRGTSADFDDQFGDGYQRYVVQDDRLNTIEEMASELSKLFHSAQGKRVGFRAKELWPIQIQVQDANGNTVIISQTFATLP